MKSLKAQFFSISTLITRLLSKSKIFLLLPRLSINMLKQLNILIPSSVQKAQKIHTLVEQTLLMLL